MSEPQPLSYAEISRKLSKLYQQRGEWAGVPMPLPGAGLVLAPNYPLADKVLQMQEILEPGSTTPKPVDAEMAGWRMVNSWRGTTKHGVQGTIVILHHDDGRVSWGLDAEQPKRNRFLFGPFKACDAWSLDVEFNAIDKLGTLVSKRALEQYMLTGQFLETSKRSGLIYLFRRGRPTVVLTTHPCFENSPRRSRARTDEPRILICLCLHPLAYYENTWSGAMVPTDDVIAHLMLMRGDERLFWRRANQHSPLDPESGI